MEKTLYLKEHIIYNLEIYLKILKQSHNKIYKRCDIFINFYNSLFTTDL